MEVNRMCTFDSDPEDNAIIPNENTGDQYAAPPSSLDIGY
jgi:hypothetical protein